MPALRDRRLGYPQQRSATVEIITTARKAAALADRVRDVSGVHEAPTEASWARDGKVIVDVFPLSDSRSTVNRAAKAVDQLAPSAGVGGVTAQYDDFISAAYGSFPVMLAIIAVLTVLLLARAFRSLLLTVKAVLLELLSISASLGGFCPGLAGGLRLPRPFGRRNS
jgi:RND superfamily putative drug exporter